jgi:hypothetical protein
MENIVKFPGYAAGVEFVDRPPAGWFVLDVVRSDENPRGRDWTALMVDVDPDDLNKYEVEFPALFYVHPNNYRPGFRKASQCWVNIAGKHRSRDAAWAALEDMIALRH